MIDYYAHASALDAVAAELAALSVAQPDIATDTDAVLNDAAAEPGAALLGAFVDHLMVHASSDGSELALLEEAAGVWRDGGVLYDTVTAARADIEAALSDPAAPDAIQRFNQGTAAVTSLKAQANDLVARSNALAGAISPLPHLMGHPRQADEPIASWDWGNRFAARRTDAFARAAFAAASGTSGRAFALGVLASYATNVTGSSYVGHVVGGPRRSHRFRNRLARNAIGGWVRDNLGTIDLPTMAARVGFGASANAASLPADVSATLLAALDAAYPGAPAANIDLGLKRLVRHLELLALFARPSLPEPPGPALAPLLTTLTATGGTSLHPLAEDPYGTGDPSPTAGTGEPTTSDSKDNTGTVCVAIIFIAVIAVVVAIDCVVQLIDHGDCDPGDTLEEIFGGDDEPEEVTTDGQLLTIATSPAGANLVQQLFQMQLMLWQAFDQAFSYLAVTGLIYPDDLVLSSPLYAQFTSIPNRPGWPLQIDPAAEANYHAYPGTPIELPSAAPSVYSIGSRPDVFVGPAPESPATAGGLAGFLWSQIARGQLDSNNRDLDADRGFQHACWAVEDGTSIADQPLAVRVLDYDEQ